MSACRQHRGRAADGGIGKIAQLVSHELRESGELQQRINDTLIELSSQRWLKFASTLQHARSVGIGRGVPQAVSNVTRSTLSR